MPPDQARRHTAHRMDEDAVPDEHPNRPADDQSGGKPERDFHGAFERGAPVFGQVEMRGQRFEINHPRDGRREQEQRQIERLHRAQGAHGQIQRERHG